MEPEQASTGGQRRPEGRLSRRVLSRLRAARPQSLLEEAGFSADEAARLLFLYWLSNQGLVGR